MARETIDLYNIMGSTGADVSSALAQLRSDFDSHNHDGVNSRAFQTLYAETLIGRAAIIGGYKLFDAIVGPTSADYKTVAAALNAGKTRIFVRNGTYTSEPKWVITTANTTIVGESYGGVDITFAQDTVNSRNIYINAANIVIQTLKLTAYETSNNSLFKFDTSASKPVIDRCILRNKNGKIFDVVSTATNLYGTFSNLYLDFTSATTAANMIAFYGINRSRVVNCYFDMAVDSLAPISTCTATYFIGCYLVMAGAYQFDITSSTNSFFSSSLFVPYQIQLQSNFEGCYFKSNGETPLNAFARFLTAEIRVVNCKFSMAASDPAVQVTGANTQIVGCYFDGGKDMIWSNSSFANLYGAIFNDNIWVSGYTTAAMTITIGSGGFNFSNSNFIGNVIRNNSNSFLPTITDNGTANNVTLNQLIKG